MGNATGGMGGGGVGGGMGGGGGAGGATSGHGSAPTQPDETSRATFRWTLDRAPSRWTLWRAGKLGGRAANRALPERGGTRTKGEVRARPDGVLLTVRVAFHAPKLDGAKLGMARAAYADAFEARLRKAGLAPRAAE